MLFSQQMDNSVYTFEQLFNQSLESQGQDDICKTIQRCQDRVFKVKKKTKQRSRVAGFCQKINIMLYNNVKSNIINVIFKNKVYRAKFS